MRNIFHWRRWLRKKPVYEKIAELKMTKDEQFLIFYHRYLGAPVRMGSRLIFYDYQLFPDWCEIHGVAENTLMYNKFCKQMETISEDIYEFVHESGGKYQQLTKILK